MTVSSVMKAKHIGVKYFRTHLSKLMKKRQPYIITDRGQPREAVIPYIELVELLEDLEELSNPELISQIRDGRKAYQKGGWIPVSRLWMKLGIPLK
ncbi:MAG: hypothetical protein AB1633_10895 [Elusimicrobiota bacterium]